MAPYLIELGALTKTRGYAHCITHTHQPHAKVSAVQDGIYAHGKACMRSTSSLRSFPQVFFETSLKLVWLAMAGISGRLKEDGQAIALSAPVSSRPSAAW